MFNKSVVIVIVIKNRIYFVYRVTKEVAKSCPDVKLRPSNWTHRGNERVFILPIYLNIKVLNAFHLQLGWYRDQSVFVCESFNICFLLISHWDISIRHKHDLCVDMMWNTCAYVQVLIIHTFPHVDDNLYLSWVSLCSLKGCRRAFCGDGFRHEGYEECDDRDFGGESCSKWKAG